MQGEPEQQPRVQFGADLQRLLDATDRTLELVRDRLPQTAGPVVRDWNDRLFLEAFARAYRCLRSVRDLAAREEAEDAGVLTRALVSLTLQYLWLVGTEDDAERADRLRRLTRKWATEFAVFGEELIDLGYLPVDETGEAVAQYRAAADALERECIRKMPSERDLAMRLDRDLEPDVPRFFELVYSRIYRPLSHVAHFGIGAAVAGLIDRAAENPGELSLVLEDRDRAAEMLGLALVTYAVLLDFSEPIIRHGLAAEVAEIIAEAHRA